MPRFVLLYHDHPRGEHWDLMLEDGPILATWEFPKMPEIGDRFEAKRLFDHGLHFLEYEGPISDDRGHVVRVAKGEFETVLRTESKWIVRFDSGPLGSLELTPSDPDRDVWHCLFRRTP